MATIIGCRTLDEWTQSYSRFIHEETEAQSHTSGHRPAPAPGSGAFSSQDLPRDTVLVPLISLGMTLSASTEMPPLPLSTGDPTALCTREREEQGPFERGRPEALLVWVLEGQRRAGLAWFPAPPTRGQPRVRNADLAGHSRGLH